jgi:hypothetical protein
METLGVLGAAMVLGGIISLAIGNATDRIVKAIREASDCREKERRIGK